MWGLNRFQRPAWSTGILIPASFLCGIVAAVFIWRGGQKTKRTKQVAERLRLALVPISKPRRMKPIQRLNGEEKVHAANAAALAAIDSAS